MLNKIRYSLADSEGKRWREVGNPERGGPQRNESMDYQQKKGHVEKCCLGAVGVFSPNAGTQGKFTIEQQEMKDEEKGKKEKEGDMFIVLYCDL